MLKVHASAGNEDIAKVYIVETSSGKHFGLFPRLRMVTRFCLPRFRA